MENIITSRSQRAIACLAVTSCLLGGCSVGPKYHTPSTDTPGAYKELTPTDFPSTDGWKVAQPKDDALRGKWWEIFNDPQLNALEEKVNVSNQSIASATASFFAARALVREARSQLFPTVTVNPSVTSQRSSSNTRAGGTTTSASGTATGTTSSSPGTFSDFSLPFDATWQPDLFGRIRNTINAAAYGAQASAADLENTRLTMQADVAMDYFQLRGQDALKQLLDSTVVAYQKSLDLTKAQYETGHRDRRIRHASRNPTRIHASAGCRSGNPAGGIRTCHSHVDRPACIDLFDSGRPAHIDSSGDSIWRSVPTAGEAPGHRFSRTSGGAGQRANRHCQSRLLSRQLLSARWQDFKAHRSPPGLLGRAVFSRSARRARRPFLMPDCAAPRSCNTKRNTMRRWPITARRC